MIFNVIARIFDPQRVTREVFIGKSHKDFDILSYQI